jgi:hypothetical protein
VKRVPPSDRYESVLEDLKDRLEKVEKKILWLQQLLKAQSRNAYTGIKLTPNQETIVNRLLATNGICSKEQLYERFTYRERVTSQTRRFYVKLFVSFASS